MPKIAEPLC